MPCDSHCGLRRKWGVSSATISVVKALSAGCYGMISNTRDSDSYILCSLQHPIYSLIPPIINCSLLELTRAPDVMAIANSPGIGFSAVSLVSDETCHGYLQGPVSKW